MEAKLVPVMGSDMMGDYLLKPAEPLVIGRADSCDIQLRQSKVSRAHCRIVFERGFFNIEDLDSKNGTWVNNRRIHRAILFHHDRIAVGSAEFRFVLETGSHEPSTSNSHLSSEADLAFGTELREATPKPDASSIFLAFQPELENAEPEQQDRFSAVCHIINKVNAENDLDRLLETIMDHVMEVTKADRGYVISARKLGGSLQPMVSRNRGGLPDYAQDNFSRTIVADCFRTNQSILLAEPTQELMPSESILAQRIQSIMCVPMADGDGPVGVLYVDTVIGSKPFDRDDLRLLAAIGTQAGIAIRRAQLSQRIETLFRESMRTVINLVEVKDEYTYGHSERVTALAKLLAGLCALGKDDERDIELAGLLHDVGKLAVRLDILQKPDRLTPAEYELIQHHPVTGAAVLAGVENSERIALAVRHHHERWDGSGYPDGLSGENIPLLARVLAVADAFDSMASRRPYRAMMNWDEIISEIANEAGKQFDPYLANRFVDALQEDGVFLHEVRTIYSQGVRPSDELEPEGEKTTFE